MPVTCDVDKAYPLGPDGVAQVAASSPEPGRRSCLRLDRAAFEAGAPRGAQGRLPPGAGLHPLPAARRDAHHRRLRLGQRRRRPDVRRRGARAATRTSRACPSSARPASCSTSCSARSACSAATSSSPTSLKCRPPGNRDPHPEEIENCQDYLLRQVELIEPRVICTLGNFATKLLRGDPTGITRLHGREEVRVIGTARGAAVPDLPPGGGALHAGQRRGRCATDFARLPELLAMGPPPQPGRRGRSRPEPPEPARAARRPRARARGRRDRRSPDGALLMVHPSAATGFARSVEAYERARPEYPPEAIAWLARELDLRPGRTVVDLAAGSGKLTRPLAALGCEVIAIEPVAEMRAAIGPDGPRARRHRRGDAAARRQRRRRHRRPGLPLVRRAPGPGRDRARPAPRRRARARVEPAPERVARSCTPRSAR